eukprot:6189397-Pleurochrysis_carterae.AAC.1
MSRDDEANPFLAVDITTYTDNMRTCFVARMRLGDLSWPSNDLCCGNPEPQTDYISRCSIYLYNIELAGQASRLYQVTKQNFTEAVVGASCLAASMLPSEWMVAKKQAIKRQSPPVLEKKYTLVCTCKHACADPYFTHADFICARCIRKRRITSHAPLKHARHRYCRTSNFCSVQNAVFN